jgi:hypothetical protein
MSMLLEASALSSEGWEWRASWRSFAYSCRTALLASSDRSECCMQSSSQQRAFEIRVHAAVGLFPLQRLIDPVLQIMQYSQQRGFGSIQCWTMLNKHCSAQASYAGLCCIEQPWHAARITRCQVTYQAAHSRALDAGQQAHDVI